MGEGSLNQKRKGRGACSSASMLLDKVSVKNVALLKKNMKAALARPRNLKVTDPSKVTGQYLMIEAIAMAYGGYVQFAAWLTQYLGYDAKAQRQRMVNWRMRGGVPLKYVYQYSQLLGIDAYALNYKAVCEQLPFKEHPTWKAVVNKCEFIPEMHRMKIANRVPYAGYKEKK